MCGIGGFLIAGPSLPTAELEGRLWAMIGTLRHRGPDDEGVWTDGQAGLAHARLSIIDLSRAAHQPMASADGSVWISYNGEVYNFAELRQELGGLGYRFRSRSDTEVIVNGWHAWGPRIFSRLRGMFALAIWDQRSRRLILARDRLGKKPLYYIATATALLFGSEIKAVLAWPGVPRVANLSAIDRYLSLGYVPSPDTAFAGICKLPAAHYLVAETRPDGSFAELELVRYWHLPEPAATRQQWRTSDLQDELVARLEEAVRLRLISDVPLGAFLSGGVDSSAVVAMMARVGGRTVKTFSIGFSAREYDETYYARMVAERYATDHTELVVEPDAVAVLPRLVWHFGEPFADSSAVPTYYVAQMARREVTVALNGDGGDECFLGYSRYKAMRYLSWFDGIPGRSSAEFERLLGLAPPIMQRRYKISRIREVLRVAKDHPGRRYAHTLASFTDADKPDCYTGAMREQLGRSALELLDPYFEAGDGLVAAANRADIHTYLPDDLMVKVDVASMAHGLEARSPLLDHLFLEWAVAIPDRVKLAHGITKALFKSAMRPYLPRKLLYRRKMGFSCPIDHWFRNELKELAYDTLLSRQSRERGLFRPNYVRQLLDEHCRSAANHHARLWALLMLELWFRMWLDGPAETEILRPAA
jgi:asparagine synthase (glutamine-hydrolysing)